MKLPLLSLYNYNPNLFEKLSIPDGLDVDLCIQNILMQNGEFGCIYLDPDFMIDAIATWSQSHAYEWERLYKTMQLEYDPITNYDRTEHSEKAVTGDSKSKETSFDSYTLQDTAGSESSGTEVFDSTVKGNIGVTTTQKMIQEEREIAAFNIYQYIAFQFGLYFCVEIY